jgi:hypothetical protein
MTMSPGPTTRTTTRESDLSGGGDETTVHGTSAQLAELSSLLAVLGRLQTRPAAHRLLLDSPREQTARDLILAENGMPPIGQVI